MVSTRLYRPGALANHVARLLVQSRVNRGSTVLKPLLARNKREGIKPTDKESDSSYAATIFPSFFPSLKRTPSSLLILVPLPPPFVVQVLLYL